MADAPPLIFLILTLDGTRQRTPAAQWRSQEFIPGSKS